MTLGAVDPHPFTLLALMQPRVPSFAALTSLALLATSDLVVSQIIAPPCNSSSREWEWSYNTLNQNACMVAAHLQAPCAGGSFTIGSVDPRSMYAGPSSVDEAEWCTCNPVTYNLISACGGCQGTIWVTWSEWSFNCTSTTLNSTYPKPIPFGTRVPQWALLDTPVANLWDFAAAAEFAANNFPDLESGSTISTSVFGVVGPTQSGSGSNTGAIAAIAGVIAGGVAALAVVGGLLFYFLWNRRRPQAPSAALVVDGAPTPLLASDMTQVRSPLVSDESKHVPGTPARLMRFYNPRDASTFPKYQSLPSTPDVHVPVGSCSNGNTSANTQTTRVQRYHGLPMV